MTEDEPKDNESITASDLEIVEEALMRHVFKQGETESVDESERFQAGGIVTGKIALDRIAIQIEESIRDLQDEFDTWVESPDDIDEEQMELWFKAKSTRELSTYVIEHLTLSMSLIEFFSIDLMKSELIQDEYMDSKKTETLLQNRLSQEDREDLLLRTGVIDQEMKSELSHIRKTRNRLVHNIDDRMFLEGLDSITSEVDRATQVVNELMELAAGGDMVDLEITLNRE